MKNNLVPRRLLIGKVALLGTVGMLAFLTAPALSTETVVRPDRPNRVTFPAQQARLVRFLIHESSSSQPCIDELEVYGEEEGPNLAAVQRGAKATASSCLTGYPQHAVDHLNDGRYGNEQSWIAAGVADEWARIELPETARLSAVVFSRDRTGRYADRVPIDFEVQVSLDGEHWKTVAKVAGCAPKNAAGGQTGLARHVPPPPPPPRIGRRDEPENTPCPPGGGPTDPVAATNTDRASRPTHDQPSRAHTDSQYDDLLRYAMLSEEHAWLKTYGYADLSSRLVPYNGRVKEYPRHVAADVLPLAPLARAAKLDAQLEDPCWENASRGVVRVACPRDFDHGPLVETAVAAGHLNGNLFLAIRTTRLLSSHVAVVSDADGHFAHVLVVTDDGLRWNTYRANGKLRDSLPVEGAFNKSLTCFEVCLPLDRLCDGPSPDTPSRTGSGVGKRVEAASREERSRRAKKRPGALRIGLGMGGKHTRPQGRAVQFVFSRLSIAEAGQCVNGLFRVRLGAASGGPEIRVSGDAPGLRQGLVLAPGQSEMLTIRGRGPIGPETRLTIRVAGGTSYSLQLLRYDPLERTLALMEAMVERFAVRGFDIRQQRAQAKKLRERQRRLMSAAEPDLAAERRAALDAHLAKRRLFFRAPELRSLDRILFVKRHAFEPSHNYSVLFDAPFRPGGGVYILDIPRHEGRWLPREARLACLFDAAEGIARNPMADDDLSTVYFSHRPSSAGYFHIMAMRLDDDHVGRHAVAAGEAAKTGAKQAGTLPYAAPERLTNGPFHDYWPCPLPDGGLAFISTRCRARYLCWRPQAAVLFRMEADGRNMAPLSFANLTEWGPSVMSDGRIIWQRSEYLDKGADFSHTLWAIRPDGTHPELIFGNDIIQPNGYANGREVPGTSEFLCTLISHFGDLNGPLALVDPALGRFNPKAITSITPEVPWPGMWPKEECFRDPVPLARDYFLCSHAPRDQFGLYVIDRFGNRELLYLDHDIGSMCPTPFHAREKPPVLPNSIAADREEGEFFVEDVYRGMDHRIRRGEVKYIRVCEEVRADLEQLADGSYQKDHPNFQDWYATPTHKVSGPHGWPSYVAKASLGIVPVEEDGSARFHAPAGKVLYFQVLDEDLNELQRMRSVVQLQPGERRSCVGCHERRSMAPPSSPPLALGHPPRHLEPPPWGAVPLAYEEVVQPVWDRHCVRCHDAADERKLDFTAMRDRAKVPASYRTLITQGWVHYFDFGWNSGGNEKAEPLTFGTVKSKLWTVLDREHFGVTLTREEKRRVKCWIDLNCPLWANYIDRYKQSFIGR